MFALEKSMSYYLCPGYVDLRRGIYSLYQLVKSELHRDPLNGEIFLFLGKNRCSIKILHWDKDGFLLYHKKLERGSYEVPLNCSSQGDYSIEWKTFVLMMEGVSLRSAKYRKRFNMRIK